MSFRVPGNLILLGEYAVLEEGGRAITAAITPCAQGALSEKHVLSGSQGHQNWVSSLPLKTGQDIRGNLPAACWSVLEDYARSQGLTLRIQGLHVNTDSFASGGQKLGYGSSAAGAVAFVKGILRGQSWRKSVPLCDFQDLAFRAHSLFQGKSGSGYDVYTSCSRGICQFRNGNPRTIRPLDLSFLPDLYLYHSSQSVSTVQGIEKYQEWKKLHPLEASEFIQKSKTLVEEFSGCRSWKDGQKILKKGAELGVMLGDLISVSAEVQLPRDLLYLPDTVCKASGAGNELILIFSPHDLTSVRGVVKAGLFNG